MEGKDMWPRLIELAVAGIFRSLISITREHEERVPRKGPLVVVSNHLGWADPPIYVGTFPRRIVFMAKAELWENGFLNMLGRGHGDIRVRRGEADRQAIKDADAALKSGLAVGIMPEGTRSRDAKLGPGEPGAAFIALRNNVPILPVGIWGTEHIYKPKDLLVRRRVRIQYGDPFVLPSELRRNLPKATDEIMTSIARLIPERYRGVYAEKAVRRTSDII
jgi:1-acyl-sn-glycerol-3-phosphate acyltransferase